MDITADTLKTVRNAPALRFRWGEGARALLAACTLLYASNLPGSNAAVVPAAALLAYTFAVLLPVWRLMLIPAVRRPCLVLAVRTGFVVTLVSVLAPVVNSDFAVVSYAGSLAFALTVGLAALVGLRFALQRARDALMWARTAAPGGADTARYYLRLAVGL